MVHTFSIREGLEKLIKLFSNRTIQILLIIFLFALALRLLCFGINPLIGLLIPDVIYFLLLGENLANGVGFTRFGAPEDKVPPIHPLIIAVSYFFGGINYQSAILPSVLIGSLLVIPVYFLGYRLYDRRVGYLAALFVASNPILWLFSGIPMSEIPFTFLSICALYFLSIKRSKKNLLLGGVFTGLSYLCRYNGILILFSYSCIVLYSLWKKRQLKVSFLEFLQYAAGFLIIT
ncbi:MAG: ArnT family glycosyltransferase, partial [Promethearchaeota archaeon]